MKYTNRYRKSKLHDSVIRCGLCADMVWLSEAVLLTKEHGYPGQYICPTHKIQISYCLVPQDVPVEQPVLVERILPNFDLPTSGLTVLDPSDYNPLDGD